jgi:hypothetical protein
MAITSLARSKYKVGSEIGPLGMLGAEVRIMTRRTYREDAFAVVRIDHYPNSPRRRPEPDGPHLVFGG